MMIPLDANDAHFSEMPREGHSAIAGYDMAMVQLRRIMKPVGPRQKWCVCCSAPAQDSAASTQRSSSLQEDGYRMAASKDLPQQR